MKIATGKEGLFYIKFDQTNTSPIKEDATEWQEKGKIIFVFLSTRHLTSLGLCLHIKKAFLKERPPLNKWERKVNVQSMEMSGSTCQSVSKERNKTRALITNKALISKRSRTNEKGKTFHLCFLYLVYEQRMVNGKSISDHDRMKKRWLSRFSLFFFQCNAAPSVQIKKKNRKKRSSCVFDNENTTRR